MMAVLGLDRNTAGTHYSHSRAASLVVGNPVFTSLSLAGCTREHSELLGNTTRSKHSESSFYQWCVLTVNTGY